MTVIASFSSPEGEPVLISDMALSKKSKAASERIKLPLVSALELDFFPTASIPNETIHSLGVKTFAKGHHALQWSGTEFTAKIAVNGLFERSTSLRHNNFLQRVVDLIGSPTGKDSLIYSTVKAGFVETSAFCCEQPFYEDGVRIIVSGSGAYGFTEQYINYSSAEIEIKCGRRVSNTYRAALKRLAHCLSMEVSDDTFYYQNYGGAYDISVWDGFQWKPLTYSIAVFRGAAGNFACSSVLSVYPSSYGTFIASKSAGRPSVQRYDLPNWNYLPNNVDFRNNFGYFVGNMSGLSSSEQEAVIRSSTRVAPHITFSIMVDESGHKPNRVVVYLPGVCGLIFRDKDAVFTRRSFMFRDAEEFFHGEAFVPPTDRLVKYYKKTRGEWSMGIGLPDPDVMQSDREEYGI